MSVCVWKECVCACGVCVEGACMCCVCVSASVRCVHVPTCGLQEMYVWVVQDMRIRVQSMCYR